MSNKIIYALWRKPLTLPSETISFKEEIHLEQICYALSFHYFRLYRKQSHQLVEDHALSRLLQKSAAYTGAKWCVVFTSGTLLKGDFFKEVERLCQEASSTTLLCGHILDRNNRGCGLHPQFFILNLELWEKLNRPKFGNPSSEQEVDIPLPFRSPENIHSDYTPLWIKGVQKTSLQKPSLFGWNIIACGLANELCFENIPNRLRDQKIFLYPEENSEALLSALLGLKKNLQATDQKSLSQAQNIAINLLAMESPNAELKIFPFNTESYLDITSNVHKPRIDCLYSVAAGFKDLFILHSHGFHEKTKIVFFDLNEKSLSFKKFLYNHWTGVDFPSFYTHLLDNLPPDLAGARLVVSREEAAHFWEQEISAWGGEVHFQETFSAVQKLEKEFHHVDLVQDPLFIAKHLAKEPPNSIAIWHSNCFNFTPSLIAADWDLHFLQNRSREYINSLLVSSLHQKEITLYGEDVLIGYKCYVSGNNLKEIFY